MNKDTNFIIKTVLMFLEKYPNLKMALSFGISQLIIAKIIALTIKPYMPYAEIFERLEKKLPIGPWTILPLIDSHKDPDYSNELTHEFLENIAKKKNTLFIPEYEKFRVIHELSQLAINKLNNYIREQLGLPRMPFWMQKSHKIIIYPRNKFKFKSYFFKDLLESLKDGMFVGSFYSIFIFSIFKISVVILYIIDKYFKK